MSVGPTVNNPDYHLRLTDSEANTIGILLCDGQGQVDGRRMGDSVFPQMALQTRQGGAGYEGQEMPYVTLNQENWGGGMGSDIFEKDQSRYLWGENISTSKGPIIKAPYPSTTRTQKDYTDMSGVLNYTERIAFQQEIYFTVGADRTITNPILGFAGKYSDLMGYEITLYENNSGAVGSEITSVTIGGDAPALLPWESPSPTNQFNEDTDTLYADDMSYLFEPVIVQLEATLTSSTVYWVGIKPYSNEYSMQSIGINNGEDIPLFNLRYYNTDQAQYVSSTTHYVPFFLYEEEGTYRTIFFQYKGALYKVVMENEVDAPKLYMNGYRGAAIANTGELERLKIGNLIGGGTLGQGEITGMTVMIVDGKGEDEIQPYRRITGMEESVPASGEYDELLVDHSWIEVHDTTTSFVVLDTNDWTEITGHGIGYPVTDVLVLNDIVYFAQGKNSSNVRLMREYNSSGTWTREFKDKSGAYDDLIFVWETDGIGYIYASKRDDCQVYKSEVVDWATNWSWGDVIQCGYGYHNRITNMISYGAPRKPFILKRNEVGYISNDNYQPLPLDELNQTQDPENGKAVTIGDVYLFFSMGKHIERYYDGRLDDMGPDRGAGMPRLYNGKVTALTNYAGRIYAAISGGVMGSSAIMEYNGYGWCCLYASPNVDGMISDLHVQSLPVDHDRLWFNDGPYTAYLPIAWNPEQEQRNFPFAIEGIMITGWIEADFSDLEKYWHSCKIFGEGIGGYNTVQMYYQTEDDWNNNWHYAGEVTANGEEIEFTEDQSLSGKRLRLKLVLDANQGINKYMEINAVLVYCVERLSTKWQHQIYFLVDPDASDLNDAPANMDEEAIIEQLRNWQDGELTPLPLTLNTNFSSNDSIKVFLDNLSISKIEQELEPERKSSYICSATLMRV